MVLESISVKFIPEINAARDATRDILSRIS